MYSPSSSPPLCLDLDVPPYIVFAERESRFASTNFIQLVAMMCALQDINEIYECEQPEEPESME